MPRIPCAADFALILPNPSYLRDLGALLPAVAAVAVEPHMASQFSITLSTANLSLDALNSLQVPPAKAVRRQRECAQATRRRCARATSTPRSAPLPPHLWMIAPRCSAGGGPAAAAPVPPPVVLLCCLRLCCAAPARQRGRLVARVAGCPWPHLAGHALFGGGQRAAKRRRAAGAPALRVWQPAGQAAAGGGVGGGTGCRAHRGGGHAAGQPHAARAPGRTPADHCGQGPVPRALFRCVWRAGGGALGSSSGRLRRGRPQNLPPGPFTSTLAEYGECTTESTTPLSPALAHMQLALPGSVDYPWLKGIALKVWRCCRGVFHAAGRAGVLACGDLTPLHTMHRRFTTCTACAWRATGVLPSTLTPWTPRKSAPS